LEQKLASAHQKNPGPYCKQPWNVAVCGFCGGWKPHSFFQFVEWRAGRFWRFLAVYVIFYGIWSIAQKYALKVR